MNDMDIMNPSALAEDAEVIDCMDANESEPSRKDSFSEDEAKAIAEAEIKRRVNAAQRKWERELKGKLEEERIRAINESKAESDAVISELRKLLGDSEKARIMRERELECTKALEERGLPLSLVPFAADEDEGVMADKLDALSAAVNDAVTRSIKEKLGDMTPRAGTRTSVSRSDIKDMSLAQLQKIYESGKTI